MAGVARRGNLTGQHSGGIAARIVPVNLDPTSLSRCGPDFNRQAEGIPFRPAGEHWTSLWCPRTYHKPGQTARPRATVRSGACPGDPIRVQRVGKRCSRHRISGRSGLDCEFTRRVILGQSPTSAFSGRFRPWPESSLLCRGAPELAETYMAARDTRNLFYRYERIVSVATHIPP